ncbi:hypothetical protein MAR_024115 [Mya arenaria]|uniref:Uncharacterized protein n=1 Tax=Mya arenaria TaxID=6604 RepID=A0ABY7DPW7_MYAAR|nr:hypothetical protein MAR_024115 [Mya arenaria]
MSPVDVSISLGCCMEVGNKMVKEIYFVPIILNMLFGFTPKSELISDGHNSTTANTSQTCVPAQYAAVVSKLQESSFYEPVYLAEFEPNEAQEKRRWRIGIEKQFSFRVSMFTVRFGNFIGTGAWVWKLPDIPNTEAEISIIADIKDKLPKFSTRAIRRDFFEQYGTILKPCELQTISEGVDNRFLKFLSTCDDEELVVDLRKHNGRLADPKFDPFWAELEKYLEEHTVVDDRRATSTSYMPLAISVDDLRSKILERLPVNTPAPSASWIRLNFMPSNQFSVSALNYTGRFNVKYAVQQRLLRAQHEDAPFALHQLYMMKDMAVKYREYSHFQCLDDKAIIPPVSTGVRAHHRGLTNNSSGLQCLDHDYHLAGIVASVAFSVAIPDHPRDSFYKGTVHVTVKDKVFQESSPLRQAAENRNIMLEHYTVDGINLEQPILFRYTDGGPDHRTTYKSVKMACLLEFISLDFDMLVCVRTAPNQTYNNPAERIMSLLNLGLQNVALSRSSMPEGFEFQAKRNPKLCRKNKPFKEAYQISMADTCTIVSERFKRLKLKEESLKVHTPASDAELDQLCSMAKLIDSSFDPKNIGNFETSEKVKKFFESHSMARQYSFQMKKCKGNSPYCILNPPRLPGDVFEGLHFLPDPVSDGDNHYKPFAAVYGTKTDDKQRPSLSLKPEMTDRDKKLKHMFVGDGPGQ